jgi:site-specific recombinase XerD/ribosomal protein L40E
MEPSYLSNGPRLVECMLNRVKEEVREPNLGYLLNYAKELRTAGKDPRTIARQLREMRFVCRVFSNRDAKQASEADIKEIVRAVLDSNLAAISKKKMLQSLRVFFGFIYGMQVDSHEYPEVVKSIKTTLRNLGKNVRSTRKGPDEIITLDEIKRMVEAADNQLERTMVMLLASTGCRVGELLNLKIANLQIVDDPNGLSHITFTGKTGTRTAPLFPDVIPFLKSYINEERKQDKGSMLPYLFIYKGKPLDFGNVRFILHKLSTRAKIQKRITSHNFRYYLSTYFAANGKQESQMSAFFGYSPSLAAHYTKLANADSIMGDSNNKPSRKSIEDKACRRCGTQNPFDARLCSKCHTELKDDEMAQLRSEFAEMKEGFEFLLNKLGLKDEKSMHKVIEKG